MMSGTKDTPDHTPIAIIRLPMPGPGLVTWRDYNIGGTNEYRIAWKKNPSSVLLTSHQAYTKLIVTITTNQNFNRKWITKKMYKHTIKLECVRIFTKLLELDSKTNQYQND
ncbi:hypothetical protein YC2023_052725 [Brassica napus]